MAKGGKGKSLGRWDIEYDDKNRKTQATRLLKVFKVVKEEANGTAQKNDKIEISLSIKKISQASGLSNDLSLINLKNLELYGIAKVERTPYKTTILYFPKSKNVPLLSGYLEKYKKLGLV